jgi:hypothetical protein
LESFTSDIQEHVVFELPDLPPFAVGLEYLDLPMFAFTLDIPREPRVGIDDSSGGELEHPLLALAV